MIRIPVYPDIPPERLDPFLADLHWIEKQFTITSKKAGFPEMSSGASLDAEVEFGTTATSGGMAHFDDDHTPYDASWRLMILHCLGHCFTSFDLNKLERLARLRRMVSPAFAALFPDDMDTIPSQMNAFSFALEEALDQGATLEQANALGHLHGLSRFGVVMQTWLDKMAEAGQLEKSIKDDKIIYWSHDLV